MSWGVRREPTLMILSALALACVPDGRPGDRFDADVADSQAQEDARVGLDIGADTDAGEVDSGLEDAGVDASADAGMDAGFDGGAVDGGCSPVGTRECPIEIAAFPFVDRRDTTQAASDVIDTYACAPSTDESGGEFVYRVVLAAGGSLSVSVDDARGDAVDPDVHLLSGDIFQPTCVARNNVALTEALDPGVYYVVVDTWVDGTGAPQAGPYTLTVDFQPIPSGDCTVQSLELKMFWSTCPTGASYHCYEAVDPADGVTYRWLTTPATGPVVKEAHLVTVAESFPGNGWPTSFTDGIPNHYQLSQAATGYVMDRSEPWAPAGEGGSQYGEGAIGTKIPVVAEAFYVNMYWRKRPSAGTRVLVRNPLNGRAVVAAAGYETGPGSNTAIGGVTEEIHHHLGTGHRDTLELGFLVDQTLPYGPIRCSP